MKNIFILLLLIPILAWGQADNPPSLWVVINLKVKQGQEESFEAAVKAHNAQFHAEGEHFAALFYSINGPYGGHYQWIMGPTSWTAMDSRPADKAHDDDWAKVNEFVESAQNPQYWNTDLTNSQLIMDPANTKSVVWMYDLKSGKGAQWSELLGKVKKVYETSRQNEDFFVAWNAFANADGEDAVIIFTMDQWADLDDQRNFGNEYEAVHGAGSWHLFLNHMSECVKQRVDWIREAID